MNSDVFLNDNSCLIYLSVIKMLDKIKRADMLAKDIYLVDKCQGTLRKSFAYQKPPSEIHMKYREKKNAEPNEVRQDNIT